jgi:hypothetical protein
MWRIVAASVCAVAGGCAAEVGSIPGRPDDAAPVMMAAEGTGATQQAAEVDARRALARELAALVGESPPEWWSYVGAMRREGFPTAVASDLLNIDRFESAGEELGVLVEPLPRRGRTFRARAWMDVSRLAASYEEEIARADEAIARMSAERGVWSDEAWAAVERLIGDVRNGREHLARSLERVRARLWEP